MIITIEDADAVYTAFGVSPLDDLPIAQLAVVAQFARHYNEGAALVTVSALTGVSRSTKYRAIEYLLENELIESVKKGAYAKR
jgi:DNA-binding transcriptional ArsR family regulator